MPQGHPETTATHQAVGQKIVPPNGALANVTQNQNQRSISWCFNFDPCPVIYIYIYMYMYMYIFTAAGSYVSSLDHIFSHMWIFIVVFHCCWIICLVVISLGSVHLWGYPRSAESFVREVPELPEVPEVPVPAPPGAPAAAVPQGRAFFFLAAECR